MCVDLQGNGSWGPNWGVAEKVKALPQIKYEGVLMIGTSGMWASQFSSNMYWTDGTGLQPHSSVLRSRGFTCNSSNPPGQNWPGCSFLSWQKNGFDIHGAISNPLFVNPNKRDLRLRPDSPAWALGIVSIVPSYGPRPQKTDDAASMVHDSAAPSTASYSVRWNAISQPVDNSTGIPRQCGADNGARCSRDAMPLGSGRAAVNAWVDTHGLAFYLRDGRALDEYHALHTLGMVQLTLTPNPFTPGNLSSFEQQLDHERGVLTVRANSSDGMSILLELFVDKLQHVVRIRVETSHPVNLVTSLFLWRGDATFAPTSSKVTNAECNYTRNPTTTCFQRHP